MAVAFDAVSESHTGTTGSTSVASFSWSHDPVGTPRGVLVYVLTVGPSSLATSVTYGGTALSAVSGGSASDTAGETGTVEAWFLGASVPTDDPATVVVNRTNNGSTVYAVAVTVTATADTEIAGTPVLLQEDGTYAEQNVNSGSSAALRFVGAFQGRNSVPPAGANTTDLGASGQIDFGSFTYTTGRETTGGSGSRPVGYDDAVADDRAAVHLAIAQVAGALSESIGMMTHYF